MPKYQSWKNCRYAIGDLKLDTSIPKVKLARALFPETPEDKLLRDNGINKIYYCKCPELIELKLYTRDGIPTKDDTYIPVAQLFYLDISENYKGPSSMDLFGNEKYILEQMIEKGLRMCGHCKFFKIKNNNKNAFTKNEVKE